MKMHIQKVVLFCALMIFIIAPVCASYTSQYPPGYTSAYVNATTAYTNLNAYSATDPSKSLTGSPTNAAWLSEFIETNQRFHLNLGSAKSIVRIYYENYHSTGSTTDRGAKNFTFWGSNTSGSFNTTTYSTDTGWTQLTTDISQFVQHVDSDTADPHYVSVTNTGSYQYYALKIANAWGTDAIGLRRVELQTEDAIGSPVTAFSANVTSGVTPLKIGFTDSSTNTPTNWDWYFGNGTKFSDLQNPETTLTTGSYSINLFTSNAGGGDWENKSDYISVSATGIAPTAQFYANITSTGGGGADEIPAYGAPATVDGYALGGNYNGATGYPTYGAGVPGGSYDGSAVDSKSELLAALSASASPAVVYVSGDANIDMGSTYGTVIPAGVTLASNRGAGGSLGGRIYTKTPGSGWEQSIFTTGGNGVRLTGIRLEGEAYSQDHEFSESTGRVGVKVYHDNFEADNNDLYGFAYADITTTGDDTYVHHNYIHESQNRHEGYGIETQGGATTTVEGNVFWRNRHSIAAYGLEGERYIMRYNRFLDLGSSWDVVGSCQVDAHGSESSGEAYSGARYDVYSNSFEGGRVATVHQRGYPSIGMFIHNNTVSGDSDFTGVPDGLPFYQTYKTPPGYGNVFVYDNFWNGDEYLYGEGVLWYQGG